MELHVRAQPHDCPQLIEWYQQDQDEAKVEEWTLFALSRGYFQPALDHLRLVCSEPDGMCTR
jgi:hypothetical protein